MHKNTTKHKLVVSAVSPSISYDTTKKRFNNEHTITTDHEFVQFTKENIIDVAKMGKIYLYF